MKVIDLIRDENRWTKEAVALDKRGRWVSPQNRLAYKFSLIGAMHRCFIPKGVIWTPEFENFKEEFIRTLLKNQELRAYTKEMVGFPRPESLNLTTFNARVGHKFIIHALEVMDS